MRAYNHKRVAGEHELKYLAKTSADWTHKL